MTHFTHAAIKDSPKEKYLGFVLSINRKSQSTLETKYFLICKTGTAAVCFFEKLLLAHEAWIAFCVFKIIAPLKALEP